MPDAALATVFVVDDDEAIRHSIHWLLQSVHLTSVMFPSAQDFLSHYSPEQPGCLLLDVRMPGMSGLDLLDHLRANHVDIPVIIMSGHGDIPMAVRALKNGALDFVQKPFNNQEMLDRIQCALRLDQANRAKRLGSQDLQDRLAKLTPREREILGHIKSGKSSKLIARELDISPKTVDVHRIHIMRKLNIHHAVELGNFSDTLIHHDQETTGVNLPH
ncbi:DNA-binding response regulator [Sulfurimicrobium lacus]|uniref:DNA-binding response regulator n=1 Tax=Sulfurimicrobium lacus TaxID=2715678 RepID=A0A6F8V8B9_9PROT|nr:response regulator [Sulfurimicrobium lacus]BCB25904.1 DNA-binding response regulator [Sulfurimicrobium lacus]